MSSYYPGSRYSGTNSLSVPYSTGTERASPSSRYSSYAPYNPGHYSNSGAYTYPSPYSPNAYSSSLSPAQRSGSASSLSSIGSGVSSVSAVSGASSRSADCASRPFTRRYGSTSDVPTQMASGNVGDKSDRSSYSSRYSRRPTSVLDSSSEVDYKAQCEELKVENEHLKEKLKNVEEQLLQSNRNASNRSSSTETQMTDRRERRAMERRISELEEEHEKMQSLIKDNTRLKEENGALIRVISKLSK